MGKKGKIVRVILFSTARNLQFKVNIFKWTPLQLLFTVAFKEWWKLLNNVEYYMTYFSKHMHCLFWSEMSVLQIRWIADSCCIYWLLQMEEQINVGEDVENDGFLRVPYVWKAVA